MSRTMYLVLALAVTGGVTYLLRLLPLLFIRKKIESPFLLSFLYYVPYVVLSALSFPAIFLSTDNIMTGIIATAVCVILALKGKGTIVCMLGSMITVIAVEQILWLIH